MDQYLERVVDLTDGESNRILNMPIEDARRRVQSGDVAAVREIEGSFGLLAREGKTVRLARSLDRPMRYFLAKRKEGPALIVADRIDRIKDWLAEEGLENQFHPSYTRMVPAHYIVEIQLIGCPDPDPVYTRFFTPNRNTLSTDLDEIGKAYIGAVADEIAKWLRTLPNEAPVGVPFSGGIDSGAVFLVTHSVFQRLGLNPARLKAFTLTFSDADGSAGAGGDLAQARQFLEETGLGLFHEPVEADLASLNVAETIRVVEDYKPLDIESASMSMTLFRQLRARYPEWRFLIDGEGGDENLKDYPIEENPELTIRSVINNLMLYHEGWGVGKIKHSLTYSGGLSRSYARSYAPARHHGFDGFSPFLRPRVIEVAEGIPFAELTGFDVDRLYALKGEIVRRGVQAVTGKAMPVFPKRRFQHGALAADQLRRHIPDSEAELRRTYLEMHL